MARRKSVRPAERRSIAGWIRLPGTAKQYRNVETGEVLSNRQYRQRFLYSTSDKVQTLESVAKRRGQPRTQYKRLLEARRDYLRVHGISANLQDIRRSDAMKAITADLKKRRMGVLTPYERRQLTPAQRARYKAQYGPDSPLAKALADLGYRDPDARHYVGDS